MESKFSEELIPKEVENIELERKVQTLERELGAIRSRSSELEEQIKKINEGFSVEREEPELEKQIDGLREGGLIQKECDEVDVWKRKCRELEARVLRLEGENSSLRGIKGERLPIASVGKPVLGLVIDISDSEDEKIAKDQGAEEPAKKVGFDFKAEATAQKSSKMMHFNQTSINVVEDDGEGEDENFLSTPAPKRKRAARVFNSDSESEDDDDIPISQLKMRRIGAMAQKSVKRQRDGVQEDATPSRRRLVPLRVRDRKTTGAKESSHGDVAARDLETPDKKDKISRNRATACRKLGYSDIEDDKEDESYDVGSESEDGSLDGFIVSGSDNLEAESDSDDFSFEGEAMSSDGDLDDVLSSIRRKKNAKKWEYEADMLASFGKDPELCMKAVCAVYRQQTSEEKSIKETILLNNRGFNTFDAKRGSLMAEFLLDGDPHGPLMKSVEELEEYDPRGLDYCHTLATRYSKQLFIIYLNKEDPYFLPS